MFVAFHIIFRIMWLTCLIMRFRHYYAHIVVVVVAVIIISVDYINIIYISPQIQSTSNLFITFGSFSLARFGSSFGHWEISTAVYFASQPASQPASQAQIFQMQLKFVVV